MMQICIYLCIIYIYIQINMHRFRDINYINTFTDVIVHIVYKIIIDYIYMHIYKL